MERFHFGRQITVAAIFALVVLMGGGCPATTPNGGLNATGATDEGLLPDQKRRADQLISLFENDTSVIQYAYVERLDDGRGYTAGRAGFTTATGDLLDVVERYSADVPENELAVLLPRLRELGAEQSAEVDGLEGLPEAWERAADDPRFRAVQDEVVDEVYYQPAVVRWRELGLETALSLAALYDAIIQHGEGDDPDGLPAMIARAVDRAGGSPSTGVDEAAWLSAFLDVRRATLENATDPETRVLWALSVDRVDVHRELLDDGNFALNGPIVVDTPNHTATIP